MNENTRQFLRQHGGIGLPQTLADTYTIVQCITEKQHMQTYLAEDRRTGGPCVIKVYEKQAFSSYEGDILQSLSHPGIPKLVMQHETDALHFVVRSYAEGHTVEEIHELIGFSSEEAVRLMVQLCDVVIYLHGQKPPVIHRDIKPANVVVGAGGAVSLIDFEISRRYSETADTDTVMALTPAFAAPEQFGYAQTSLQSDIYAMGVMLLYMVTGSAAVGTADKLVQDKALLKVIKRCAAFDPADRYRDAAAFKRDLLRIQRHARRRAWQTVLAAAAIVLAVGAGFFIGARHMAARPAEAGVFDPVAVAFAEPLVERAVRLQLDMDDETPIYPADLGRVTQVYIYGNRVAKTGLELGYMSQNAEDYGIIPGSIRTLEDFARMKNLQDVGVSYQPLLESAQGLEGLTKLTRVDLSINAALADITALAGLRNLKSLYVINTAVEDIGPVAQLPLTDLQIVGTPVVSIAPIAGSQTIEQMQISWSDIEDLDVLITLPNLEHVGAYGYERSQFEKLGPFDFEVILSENINPREGN